MEQTLTVSLPAPTADLQGYLRSIQQFPLLSADEERSLAETYQKTESIDAAWRLVTSHLRYVAKLARGFRGYGLPEEDVIQEGNVGLMKAVKRFDPAHGVRLASFAVHWIRAEIHEYVLKNWRMVKVATTKAQRKLFFNLRGAKSALGHISLDEAKAVAEDLDVKVSEVMEMDKRLSGNDMSFDPLDGNDSFGPADWLEGETVSPEEAVTEAEYQDAAQGQMLEALSRLDSRSQDIVRRRWLSEPKAPLRELADEYGVSMERIRQIEAQAMIEMRDAVESQAGALMA